MIWNKTCAPLLADKATEDETHIPDVYLSLLFCCVNVNTLIEINNTPIHIVITIVLYRIQICSVLFTKDLLRKFILRSKTIYGNHYCILLYVSDIGRGKIPPKNRI